MEKTIAIAITGSESSGKSELTVALAKHYNAPLVKEYAREYLKDIGTNYSQKDVEIMAKKQIEMEKDALKLKPKLVFYDTDAINFKIWFEFYNMKTPKFIENYIETKPYTHTLLLYPNTPWINDGLRQNENDRLTLFNLFEKHLNFYHYKYNIIDKLNIERVKQAIEIVDTIFYNYP